MKNTKILGKGKSFKEIVSQAARVLEQGGVIVFPTETCYGIGCLPEKKNAAKKVYVIKGRPTGKGLPVYVSSLEKMKEYAFVSDKARKLVEKLMPGKITLILKKRKKLSYVASGDTIALRIPENKLCTEIMKKTGKGLIASSANSSGQKELWDGRKVIKEFEGKVDMIIDYGKLEKVNPSTVYDTEKNKVLRDGPVKEREIRKALRG